MRTKIFSSIILIILFSCNSEKKNNYLEIVDTAATFEEKELLLQDIAKIEYIPLETTQDFLLKDAPPKFIDDNIIILDNFQNGDVMIFNRKEGKAISKFNRKGDGPEEYIRVGLLSADSKSREIFIQDAPRRCMLVYDLQGNFKRKLDLPGFSLLAMFNYDDSNLICYDENRVKDAQPLFLIDKNDGHITHEFFMPETDRNIEFTITNGSTTVTAYMNKELVKTNDGYLVGKPSLDTIYRLNPSDNKLVPHIVRTPAILESKPQTIIYPLHETKNNIFLVWQKIEVDFSTNRMTKTKRLAYSKESGECFIPQIKNADYDKWQTSNIETGDYDGTTCFVLSAAKLVAAQEEGGLRGELASIAASITEESNPVLLIARFRE